MCVALAAAGLVAALPASGSPPRERPFVVAERPGTYAVADRTHQQTVPAADGTEIFVETWLPAVKGNTVPPRRVPVVVVVTPYAMKGLPRPDRLTGEARWTQVLVSRGYALANVHLRGTGESGGCWGVHGQQDADDAARALEALAKAPFSDGRLALFGKSHDGGAAINVAARGDRNRTRSVKALITASPVLSYADTVTFDGVVTPVDQVAALRVDADTTATSRSSGTTGGRYLDEYAAHGTKDPQKNAARTPCRGTQAAELLTTDGRVTPWLAERELALHTPRLAAPLLMTYGLEEFQTTQLTGAFDRVDAPKAAVLSASDHDYPDRNSRSPSLSRRDFEAMTIAWLDRWVRGVRNGADRWPAVQVQDTTGQWRAERGFPRTGGPAAQLALGAGGVLGAAAPSGSTSYRELTSPTAGTAAAFSTPELDAPLHVSGQPLLDLWVRLDRPAAYVQASLEVVEANGARPAVRYASRSVQFLEPLRGDRFVQSAPVAPPVGEPVRVVVRFPPADLVVPEGARLVVRLVGVRENVLVPPSGGAAEIAVLHDCAHPSRLRFLLPRAVPDLLDVLEADEEPRELGGGSPAYSGLQDGGGLATARVCGRTDARDVELQGAPRG